MDNLDVLNFNWRETQIWDPVKDIQFGEKWVTQGWFTEKFTGNNHNTELFWLSIGNGFDKLQFI